MLQKMNLNVICVQNDYIFTVSYLENMSTEFKIVVKTIFSCNF